MVLKETIGFFLFVGAVGMAIAGGYFLYFDPLAEDAQDVTSDSFMWGMGLLIGGMLLALMTGNRAAKMMFGERSHLLERQEDAGFDYGPDVDL